MHNAYIYTHACIIVYVSMCLYIQVCIWLYQMYSEWKNGMWFQKEKKYGKISSNMVFHYLGQSPN